MNNLSLALPEIFLACTGLFLLLFGALRGDKSSGSVTILAVLAFVIAGALILYRPATGTAMHEMFAVDAFRRFVKVMILVASGLALALSPAHLKATQSAKPEYPVLVLFATLGMMLMVSAYDLIALYVGLELQNLALYVLAAFRRNDPRSSEAGLKYFTLGALSSAILLFGLSLVYGFTGTTGFSDLALLVTENAALASGLSIGVALVVAGFAFKVSAVPFHMWTPDVYEGAPTPVTTFLAAAPKIAALSLVACVLAQPLAEAASIWRPILMFLAVASMLLGSFGGLLQSNIKRLMAYSAIANVGTMLIALVVYDGASPDISIAGLQGLLLYLAFYSVGTLAVFAVLSALHRSDKPVEALTDLAGLSKTNPYIALALAIALFSLAGVPPLAGFFGKYFVLLAAVRGGMVGLAVVGVLTSVVAAGYYLRFVKIIYFDAPKGLPLNLVSEKIPRLVVALAAFVLVVFILSPSPLIESARRAAESLIVP